jgi:hypothetical protein
MADRARPAGDQHRLAAHRAVREQAAVGGHRRDPQAGAELEGGVVRQGYGLALGHHRPLRRGPPPAARRREPEPDPLADPGRVHSLADRVDHPGAVLVRDLEPVHGARGGAAAALVVGRVDRGHRHLDPDLAGPGLRRSQLLDPQHLGSRSMGVVQRGLHGGASCNRAAVTDASFHRRPRPVPPALPHRGRVRAPGRARPGMPAAGKDTLCPAAQTMTDQALSTASISSWMVTLSLTTTPPPSMAAL